MRPRIIHGLALVLIGTGLITLAHLAWGNPFVSAFLFEAAGVFLFLGGLFLIHALRGAR